MSPGGLGSTGSRLKPAAARIGRPTRPGAFSTLSPRSATRALYLPDASELPGAPVVNPSR